MLTDEQLAQIDGLVAQMPRGERRCDTCALCKLVNETNVMCTAEWVAPANIACDKSFPADSVKRWMSRKDVERWESRRQQDCGLWQSKTALRVIPHVDDRVMIRPPLIGEVR